jgi:amidase
VGDTKLHWQSARELAVAVRARDLSAVEVVTAFLDRIEAVNPDVNAIVSLHPQRALRDAAQADTRAASGDPIGPLHGLPIAVKDLLDVAGMRTTYGSPIFAERVAESDSVLAQRLRQAGAIIVGKTNTSEFGVGSQTFNPVFGPTRNPYQLDLTAGGSSGGAAAAVAAGMLPFADASDLGGSIRNPSSFCNLVGLRPSPGRVPGGHPGDAWSPMIQLGPIARSVDDLGLLLSAMAGRHDRSPITLESDPAVFGALEPADLRDVRVAWSATVDGLPIDPKVTQVLGTARAKLVALGCRVEDHEPDLAGADEVFDTYRSLEFMASYGPYLETHRDQIKPEAIEEIERGQVLTASQIVRAAELRTDLFRRTAELLETYDLLALPTVQVPPFAVETEWVREIAGVTMDRYCAWQRSCSRITATLHPALSIPAGFTSEGLPIGLQLVGRHRDELGLLRHAAALERAGDGFHRNRPLVRNLQDSPAATSHEP